MRWCNRHDTDPQRAWRLCASMWAVVHQGRADDVVIVGRQTIERWPFDGSSIAGAAVAWVGLRVDPAAALAEIEDALEMSRRIDYPIGIAVNLRSRAFAQLLLDDADAARATIAALLDDVLERGAMSHARLVIDVAAVLAHRIGDPSWAQLASTAAVLPTATLVGAGYDLMPLPAGGARPLGRREAIATVVRLLATTPPIAEATPSTGARGADEASPSLVERGPVWEMGYRGRVVTVRASKGLADLAVLLAAPGREHHCLDLTGAGTQEASTGEVIDAAARRAYESRIRDLQEEVDDAELAHDLARAERAQVELDALVDHLMAATGRGGRTRQTSGTAERARTAVTQRLRSTMRQLADAHPELGRHLQASVTTGLYCSYTPPDDTTWNVQRAPSR